MSAMLKTTDKALVRQSFATEILVVPVPVRQSEAVQADPHKFTDCMETALTGLVFVAVLLFGAGLLRGVVPACLARFWAEAALYGGAGFTVLLTTGLTLRRCLAKIK